MFIISLITINSNERLKQYYEEFYLQLKKIISLYSYRIIGIGSDLQVKKNPFINEFDAGLSTFKLNKYVEVVLNTLDLIVQNRQIKIQERTSLVICILIITFLEHLTDRNNWIFNFDNKKLILTQSSKLLYSNTKYLF